MEERSDRRHRLWSHYVRTRDCAARARLVAESAGLLKWSVERLALDLPPSIPLDLLLDYAAAALQDVLDEGRPAAGVKYDTLLLSRVRTAILDALRRCIGSDAAIHHVVFPLLHNSVLSFRENGALPPADVLVGRPGATPDEVEGLLSGVSLAVLVYTCGNLMCETTGGGAGAPRAGSEWDAARGALAGAICRLPRDERTVLSLYHFEGFTISEIARVMGSTRRSASALFALGSLHVLGQVSRVLTTVSEDRMSASARIWPWADGPGAGEYPGVAVVCAEVRCAGVLHGVLREAVEGLLASPRPGKESIVARATAPKDGRDGRVVRLFAADPGTAAEGGPVVKGWVSTGEALVKVEPPTRGADGVDVTGLPLRARDGVPAAVECGPNSAYSADGIHVVSSIDGQAWLVADPGGDVYVDVVRVLRVESIEGRSLQFAGTLVVSGAIGPESCVEATWDVFAGRIECSTVTAGGDVCVRGGVTACTGPGVTAGCDVRAGFVETSVVRAAGRVYVGQRSLQSRIEGCVAVVAAGAWVCGGSVVSAGDVHVGRAGAELAMNTVLAAGERSRFYEDVAGASEVWSGRRARDLEARVRALSAAAVLGLQPAGECAIHASHGVHSGVVLRVAGVETRAADDLGPGRAALSRGGWPRWEAGA